MLCMSWDYIDDAMKVKETSYIISANIISGVVYRTI